MNSTDRPTDQQLNDIEARAQAATAGPWGIYEYGNDGSVTDIAAEVRRLRTQSAEMTASLARDGFSPDEIANMTGPTFEAQPVPLRWGLDDVMYGDDDTTTVLLSGPDGEPYWLELAPERTAALRECLAGPDGEQPTDGEPESQPDTGTRPCGHDDYHDSHEWAGRPGVWCPGLSFADDEPATPAP